MHVRRWVCGDGGIIISSYFIKKHYSGNNKRITRRDHISLSKALRVNISSDSVLAFALKLDFVTVSGIIYFFNSILIYLNWKLYSLRSYIIILFALHSNSICCSFIAAYYLAWPLSRFKMTEWTKTVTTTFIRTWGCNYQRNLS